MIKKLAILAALLAAALAGGFFWVRSWLTPEYLRAQIEARAKDHYAGAFTVREIGVEFPLAVTARGVRVADGADKVAFLELPEASARLEPWALLSREVHITSFEIVEPKVIAAFGPDGELAVMKLLKGGGGGDTTTAAPALAVSDLTLTGAHVTVRRPGVPDLVVAPIDARVALLGQTLTVRSLSLKAMGAAVTAAGEVEALLSAPALSGVVVKAEGGVPPGVLDPASVGKVTGTAAVEATLSGPPAAPTGPVKVRSAGFTWTPADASLAPVETGTIEGEGTLEGLGVDLKRLAVRLWGGDVTLAGRVDAAGAKLTGAVAGVKAGTWLGPMLEARGFGPTLGALTVDAKVPTLAATEVAVTDLAARAAGLAVTGSAGLRAGQSGFDFAPGSALAGTFAGPDLLAALAVGGVEVEGDLETAMKLAGPVLRPTITGDLAGPALKIRRPGVFSLPVQDLAGTYRYEAGKLKIPDLRAAVTGGTLTATSESDLNAQPPEYRFTLKGARLGIPKLLEAAGLGNPFEGGLLDLDFHMKGAGTDPKRLDGEGKAAFEALRLAVNPTLETLATKLKEPKLTKEPIDGKFKVIEVRDGRVHLGDFAGKNGKFGPLRGDGSVGFDGSLKGEVGATIPLNSAQLPEPLRGKSLPVTLKLGGTTAAPTLALTDIDGAFKELIKAEATARLEAEKAKLAAKAAEERAKLEAKAATKIDGAVDKLFGKLGDKLGGSAPASAATSGAAPAAPDPKEALKSKAKGLLRGLFR